jgi:antitoxin VapB
MQNSSGLTLKRFSLRRRVLDGMACQERSQYITALCMETETGSPCRKRLSVDSHGADAYHEIYHLTKRIKMHQTAKIFVTGRSQAVRLPLEFRFDVAEVFIRRDPATGDVVLSRKPTDWQGLLDVVAQNKEDDLLVERRQTHSRRDPFEGSPE